MNLENLFSKTIEGINIYVICEWLVYNLLNWNVNKFHFIVSGKTAKFPLGAYDTLGYK